MREIVKRKVIQRIGNAFSRRRKKNKERLWRKIWQGRDAKIVGGLHKKTEQWCVGGGVRQGEQRII